MIYKNKESIISDIKYLKNEIIKHDHLYHSEDDPQISDYEYDKLKKRLNSLFLENQDLLYLKKENNFDKKIGGKVKNSFAKITHQLPMLSLDNAFNDEDIKNFIKRNNRFLSILDFDYNNLPYFIYIEPKIDGLSFSAYYKNNILQYAATRGNSIIGEDITEAVKLIDSFPVKLNNYPYKKDHFIEIRGEIYMSKSDFINLNNYRERNNLKLFANPRNAAAGSIRQLDLNKVKERNLKYFVYNIGTYSNFFKYDLKINSQDKLMSFLQDNEFITNKLNLISNNLDDLRNYYNKISNMRYELEYDIDGMVYKINDFSFRDRLGNSAKSPRWAIAYKFANNSSVTKVNKIITQIGRTGAVTPVAILTPVNIGGALITRATLHNRDEIIRKDIRENDIVLIERSGDVIPKITKVKKEKRNPSSSKFIFPTNCPSCNSILVKYDNDAIIRCENDNNCPEQIKQSIIHFVSKDAFDIIGLGKKQIENFFNEKRINSVIDIFDLEEREIKNDDNYLTLRDIEGWKEKSIANLFKSINDKRKIDLYRFIYAINIRHIGVVTAKLIANFYKDYFYFKNKMIKISSLKEEEKNIDIDYNNFISIDSIGEKIIESIISFFRKNSKLYLLSELEKRITIKGVTIDNKKLKSDLSQKNIIFTGSLKNMSRNEAKKIAEQHNMRILNMVSSKLDYLVYGDKAGSKLKKAKELQNTKNCNIKIISELEWEDLIK